MNAKNANVIAGFTEVQAERLTGVSQRQLRYWASSSFFRPSLKVEDAELSDMRLYSFRDLACLKVIAALRNEAKVPLQELRRVKSRLIGLGEDLWATTTLYVLGKRVVFDNPETGGKEEAATGQGVFQIPLKVVTGEIEEAIRRMRSRKSDLVGKIERKRGVAEHQPIVAGTRIPVRSIKAFAEADYSIDEIIEQYPTLTRADIEAALAHEDAA
jgi:uncharacterized protein (DUF433 family)